MIRTISLDVVPENNPAVAEEVGTTFKVARGLVVPIPNESVPGLNTIELLDTEMDDIVPLKEGDSNG